MKKKGLVGFASVIIFVLVASFAVGQGVDEASMRNDAMGCLRDQVDLSSSLSLPQAIFSALAGLPSDKPSTTISAKKSASEACWAKDGGSGCDIKTTAQVLLAKQKMGQSTSEISDWLLNQTRSVQGLTWYLQVLMEDNLPADCIVNYNGNDNPISIDENMKLSGSTGNCLQLAVADQNNWMIIADSCLDTVFNIRCDPGRQRAFKTNLLYRRGPSGVLSISSFTHGANYPDWTHESISAKCFANGGTCDYEGSLWAASALKSSQKDTSEFTPYLLALSSENEKFFPEAFIHFIIQDMFEEVMAKRDVEPTSNGNYWNIPGSTQGKLYDTSLAMLALGGMGPAGTLSYLDNTEDSNGCWGGGNIRDTAFIIYTAPWGNYWSGAGICSSNGDCSANQLCNGGACVDVPSGNSCASMSGTCESACDSDEREINADCVDTNDKCCTKLDGGNGGGPITPPTGCTNLDGAACKSACDVNETAIVANCPDQDNLCCTRINNTETPGPGPSETPTQCSLAGNYCVSGSDAEFSCVAAGGSVMDSTQYYCNTFAEVCCTAEVSTLQNCFDLGGSVCAVDKQCSGSIVASSDSSYCCLDTCELISSGNTGGCTSNSDCSSGKECTNGSCVTIPDEGGGSLWVWIVILLILIVLVVLGIIYRDKLRIWWFKMRGKAKTSNAGPRPGMPPGAGLRRRTPLFRPRPIRTAMPLPVARPPARRASNPKDREMEDTLKKLKEMSK